MKPIDSSSSPDTDRHAVDVSDRDGQQEHVAPQSELRWIARTLTLLVLVLGLYVLHQDFWNWPHIEPLLFGFLPVGLTYHVVYSILAALMMAVLVKFAWPAHLEKHEPNEPSSPERSSEGKS